MRSERGQPIRSGDLESLGSKGKSHTCLHYFLLVYFSEAAWTGALKSCDIEAHKSKCFIARVHRGESPKREKKKNKAACIFYSRSGRVRNLARARFPSPRRILFEDIPALCLISRLRKLYVDKLIGEEGKGAREESLPSARRSKISRKISVHSMAERGNKNAPVVSSRRVGENKYDFPHLVAAYTYTTFKHNAFSCANFLLPSRN